MPYPIEIFEMKLLEDGISAFQLIPPHSPQVWQQLVPFFCAQPVCFASLGEEKNKVPRAFLFTRQREGPRSVG